MTITVQQFQEATLVLNEDMNAWVCNHADAYLEPACCTFASPNGLIECGCGGQDSVVCPAVDCTGIEDHEVEGLFERLGA